MIHDHQPLIVYSATGSSLTARALVVPGQEKVMAHDPGFRVQIGQADASGGGNPVPATMMLATREFAHDVGERIAITAAMALLVVVQILVCAIVWTGLGIAWLLGKRG